VSIQIEAVKIGGIVYQVQLVPDLADGKQKLDGHIQYRPCLIQIEAQLAEQMQMLTLWHEILHAMLTQAGQKQLPEPVIEALTYGIFQALRDNPKLAEIP